MVKRSIFFLLIFFLLLIKPSYAIIPEGQDRPPSKIYAMTDWRNCDYWTTYDMGSQYAEFWSYFSIASNLGDTNSLNQDYPSHYDWSKFKIYLDAARNYKNQSGGSKPVILTIQMYQQGGTTFYVRAPNWLGANGSVDIPVTGCDTIKAPNYLNPDFQTALKNTIYQFGRFIQQYETENKYKIAGIFIASGIDDESRSAKKYAGCDYYAKAQAGIIPDGEYNIFVKNVMNWYRQAFPNKAIFIQPAAATEANRAQIVEAAAKLNIGIKMNGLTAGDTCGAHQWGGPLANRYRFVGFADYWHNILPVAFEPKFTINNPQVAYWVIMQGLAHKVDLIDIQSCPYKNCNPQTPTEPLTCNNPNSFPAAGAAKIGINQYIPTIPYLEELIDTSLGVHSARRAKMIWIVLRDHFYPNLSDIDYCNDVGEYGDWDFYLYRPENITDFSLEVDSLNFSGKNPYQFNIPDSQTSQVRTGGSGFFDRQYRVLKAGNKYMTFKADKNWVPKQLKMEGFKIIVTAKDTNGSISLDYYNKSGSLQTKSVNMDRSNQFKDFEFILTDGYLGNQLYSDLGPVGDTGADFRLSSSRELAVHRVIVESLHDFTIPDDGTGQGNVQVQGGNTGGGSGGPSGTVSPLPTYAPGSTITPNVSQLLNNPLIVKIASLTFKVKPQASGKGVISFRSDPLSKILERTTLNNIIGNKINFNFSVGTAIPSGTPSLNFKIKFRSVFENKGGQFIDLKVRKDNQTKEFLKIPVKSDNYGNYQGPVNLLGITPGTGYSIYVKGPKHIDKKFENITLNNGLNTFDWTAFFLEPGDVPVQDNVINSSDISKIVERIEIKNPSEEDLNIADLNYDGVINGADMNELLLTLQSKSKDDSLE